MDTICVETRDDHHSVFWNIRIEIRFQLCEFLRQVEHGLYCDYPIAESPEVLSRKVYISTVAADHLQEFGFG